MHLPVMLFQQTIIHQIIKSKIYASVDASLAPTSGWVTTNDPSKSLKTKSMFQLMPDWHHAQKLIWTEC